MDRPDADAAAIYSRSHRTKLNIARSLNELCQKRPFSKIPIEAVATEANVSRSSFYHHFEDKNDVVKWLSRQCYANGIDQIGRTLTWFEGHLVTTKEMERYSKLFVSAASSTEYNAGRPFFIRHRQSTLAETITDYQHAELTTLLLFQIEALPQVEMIMANNYINGSYEVSLKEFCSMMVSLVPRELYTALEEPVDRTTPQGSFFLSQM